MWFHKPKEQSVALKPLMTAMILCNVNDHH